jgi:hypothetical protein
MDNYRIVRISNVHYGDPAKKIYADDPGLESLGYEEQQSAVFKQRLVYSDSFTRAMRALGNDAYEIVSDIKHLQMAWARDYGLKICGRDWQSEIVLHQISTIRPDVVYLQDIHSLPLVVRQNLKDKFPFIKLVVVFRGYPGFAEELKFADLVFAGSPAIVSDFAKDGLNSRVLYHAFDDKVLENIKEKQGDEREYDFTFCGSSGFGWGLGHQARYWTLRELAEKTPLEMWIDERSDLTGDRKKSLWSNLSAKKTRFAAWRAVKRCMGLCGGGILEEFYKKTQVTGMFKKVSQDILNERRVIKTNRELFPEDILFKEPRVPDKPLRCLFPDKCYSPVFGLDMYDILRRSKVTFNRHTDAAMGSSANVRLFEATGVGACLLTDAGKNLSELFEIDKEIVVYSSLDECMEKVKYLLNHESERAEISQAGFKRTLRDHTALNRCQTINHILQKLL